MTRLELIQLGKKIVDCLGSEKEVDQMINTFNDNVPYPNGAILFFYPENYNASGYFGVMVPGVSVKWCHFERYCNYS